VFGFNNLGICYSIVNDFSAYELVSGNLACAGSCPPATSYAGFCTPGATPPGPVTYWLESASSNDVMGSMLAREAIDANTDTYYSSRRFSSAANDRGSYLAGWTHGQQPVSSVLLTARMHAGTSQAFATNYDVYLTPDNSTWSFIGNFDATPDSTGAATIPLGTTYQTYGVMLIPKVLATDSAGRYYFQLAELTLGN
jgi:hypothetical protein